MRPSASDRQAEPDHCRRAHRTPEIEVPVVVADRRGIPSGRAEPGDEQQVTAIFEQGAHRGTTVESVLVRDHFTHRFAPSNRRDSSTTTARSPLKAMSSAAATVSALHSDKPSTDPGLH